MTVIAPDVAQALTAAWWTFRKAVGNDMEGWDMAGAIAEVRPGEHYPRGFKEQDGPDGPGIQRDDVATRTHERPALRPLLTGSIYLARTSGGTSDAPEVHLYGTAMPVCVGSRDRTTGWNHARAGPGRAGPAVTEQLQNQRILLSHPDRPVFCRTRSRTSSLRYLVLSR